LAWDTERTRTLLLAAAVNEFSNKGLAGGRVDQIAAAAGVNKERIYQYFGKKDALFDAVLAAQLTRSVAKLTIEGEGAAAVGEYAGRLFDLHVTEPTTARLLFWEGLEKGAESDVQPTRIDHATILIRTLQHALPGIDRDVAADLLITLVTLCSAWGVLPQLDAILAGPDADRTGPRREHIVRTATLLAESLHSGRATARTA